MAPTMEQIEGVKQITKEVLCHPYEIFVGYRDGKKTEQGKECMKCGKRYPKEVWDDYVSRCNKLYGWSINK